MKMNKKLFLMIFSMFLLFIIVVNVNAWYDDDFTYRNEYSLNPGDNVAYSDITHDVNVSYHSSMNVDFTDIVITDSSDNLIPFYQLSKVDSAYALYRIRVSSIQGATTIHVYYNSKSNKKYDNLVNKSGTSLLEYDNGGVRGVSGLSNWGPSRKQSFNASGGYLTITDYSIEGQDNGVGFHDITTQNGHHLYTPINILFQNVDNPRFSSAYAMLNTRCNPATSINNGREDVLVDLRSSQTVASDLRYNAFATNYAYARDKQLAFPNANWNFVYSANNDNTVNCAEHFKWPNGTNIRTINFGHAVINSSKLSNNFHATPTRYNAFFYSDWNIQFASLPNSFVLYYPGVKFNVIQTTKNIITTTLTAEAKEDSGVSGYIFHNAHPSGDRGLTINYTYFRDEKYNYSEVLTVPFDGDEPRTILATFNNDQDFVYNSTSKLYYKNYYGGVNNPYNGRFRVKVNTCKDATKTECDEVFYAHEDNVRWRPHQSTPGIRFAISNPHANAFLGDGQNINGTYNVPELGQHLTLDKCQITEPTLVEINCSLQVPGEWNFTYEYPMKDLVFQVVALNGTMPVYYARNVNLFERHLVYKKTLPATDIINIPVNGSFEIANDNLIITSYSWTFNDTRQNAIIRDNKIYLNTIVPKAGTYTSAISVHHTNPQFLNFFQDDRLEFGKLAITECPRSNDPNKMLEVRFRLIGKTILENTDVDWHFYDSNQTNLNAISSGRTKARASYSFCDNTDNSYNVNFELKYNNNIDDFVITNMQLGNGVYEQNIYIDNQTRRWVRVPVRDNALNPLADYIIQVYKYYHGRYYLISSVQTDDRGYATIPLVVNDRVYKFVIQNENGATQQIFDNRKIACDSTETDTNTVTYSSLNQTRNVGDRNDEADDETRSVSNATTESRAITFFCRIEPFIIVPNHASPSSYFSGYYRVFEPKFNKDNLVVYSDFTNDRGLKINVSIEVTQDNTYHTRVSLCKNSVEGIAPRVYCNMQPLVSDNPLFVRILVEQLDGPDKGKIDIAYNRYKIAVEEFETNRSYLTIFVFMFIIMLLMSLYNQHIAMLSIVLGIIIGIGLGILSGDILGITSSIAFVVAAMVILMFKIRKGGNE